MALTLPLKMPRRPCLVVGLCAPREQREIASLLSASAAFCAFSRREAVSKGGFKKRLKIRKIRKSLVPQRTRNSCILTVLCFYQLTMEVGLVAETIMLVMCRLCKDLPLLSLAGVPARRSSASRAPSSRCLS